jgi:hypothetical protein
MTEFPFMSLVDRIVRFVKTPGSIEKMVTEAKCGPALKEQWHGRIFRENPLFTVDRFRDDDKIYTLDENWIYKNTANMEQLVMITGIVCDEKKLEDKFFVRLRWKCVAKAKK